MVNQDRLVEEFIKLVKINSTGGSERKIADFLIGELKGLGLSVYEDKAGEKVGTTTGNLIARLPANITGVPALMFCSHMDTVQPGDNIQPVIKDGIIYSSGDTVLGADDKAGIAAIIETLRVIKERDIKHGDLVVVFTILEEGGLLGAKNIEFERIKADMGIVLDSDGDPGTIVVRGPSQDKIIAIVKGKAAHAGINPQDGINSIQVASKAIAKMKLGRIDHETTSNIGVINGGKAINIVPDTTTVQGETRSLSKEKRIAQTESICKILEEAALQACTSVDIKVETIYHDMHLEPGEPVVDLVAAAGNSLGLDVKFVSTGGGSDAHFFNYYGLPTVNLGIGMKQVHTTSEYITISNLITNAKYILEIIETAKTLNKGRLP